MNANAIITVTARKAMVKARAGLGTLPTIIKMAFGDGGVDAQGDPIAPASTATALNNELMRKDLTAVTPLSDTTVQYACRLTTSELAGTDISEIALVDSNGDLACIKTFPAKSKDNTEALTFTIDDIF